MATFAKRGDTWRAQVRRAGRSLSKSFATKQDAQRWARQMEAQIDVGKNPASASAVTFAAVAGAYEAMKGGTMRRSTRYTVTRLVSHFGNMKCEGIDYNALSQFVSLRERGGAKPSTIMRDIAVLKSVLRYGATSLSLPDLGLAADGTMRMFMGSMQLSSRLSHSRPRDRRPTEKELEQIISVERRSRADSPPLADIVLFAISTAMRQAEITRLHWSDLNIEKRTIVIRNRKDPRATQGNHMEVPLLRGPTVINNKIIDPLEIIQRQPVDTSEPDRIFPYNPQSVSTAFTRVVNSLKINNLRFHDLRHDGVSRLFEAGYQIHEVALVSGHKSWSNLKRYTHLRADQLHRS